VTGWENLDVHASETIVWVCLAFSILSADLVLQWQQGPRKDGSLPMSNLRSVHPEVDKPLTVS